jgi:hypothetical protein
MQSNTFKTVAAIVAGTAIATALVVPVVLAGSPHFVGSITVTRTDNSLTVSGKEAGLGNEAQINIVVTATASCINPGDNHPKAANKQSLSKEGVFPVQNGKANFELTVTASFQPDCSPPMTVIFTDVTVADTTNGISQHFDGPF